MPQTAGADRRTQLKEHYWPEDAAWNGAGMGWFKGPRTLPLILALLSDKNLTAGRDIAGVYLELLSRHFDGGVIEMGNEADHAYAAGYTGSRAIRTWHERMMVLQELGFIKSKHVGNQRYKLVFVVDPLVAINKLRVAGKVADSWWEAYLLRLMETKEADPERLQRITGVDSLGGKKAVAKRRSRSRNHAEK